MHRLKNFKDLNLFDLFESGICIMNSEGEVLYWNRWLANHTGKNEEDVEGKKLYEIFPYISKNKLQRKISISLRAKIPSFFLSLSGYLIKIKASKITNPQYKYMQQSATIYPIDNEHVFLNITDQTSLKTAERELAEFMQKEKDHMDTMFDKLTGLGSRSKLLDDLANMPGDNLCSLINLDGFNEVNDFYGFEIGDKLLIYLANQLRKFSKLQQFNCYKLPSAEYAIVNLNRENTVENFITLLHDFFEEMSHKPYIYNTASIPISLVGGVATGDSGILRLADIAMKQARKKHQSIALYDDSLSVEDKYKTNMVWLNKLTHAISADRIVPFFQPIINNKTKQVEKYESLARMIDDDGRIISPFFFIDIARRAKMYPRITQIMIEKSFARFRHEKAEFSVNLSVDDILNPDTVNLILGLIKDDPSFSKRIVFEILESEGIENFDEVLNFIQEVKSYGCKIAIDDFGTGYSNFFYLTQLSIDYLKIDGSLIKTVHQDRHVETVVEALIDLARKLDAKVIGEFVHCQEVLEKVQDLQIDYSQGFHLGEPKGDLVTEQPAALKK